MNIVLYLRGIYENFNKEDNEYIYETSCDTVWVILCKNYLSNQFTLKNKSLGFRINSQSKFQ